MSHALPQLRCWSNPSKLIRFVRKVCDSCLFEGWFRLAALCSVCCYSRLEIELRKLHLDKSVALLEAITTNPHSKVYSTAMINPSPVTWGRKRWNSLETTGSSSPFLFPGDSRERERIKLKNSCEQPAGGSGKREKNGFVPLESFSAR